MSDIGIKISAIDAASGVFKSVAAEAGKLQSAVGSIGSSLGTFATTAVAGLSVLSFTSQIKQAIDLADSFNKLSQKTGVAVDELSKLNYAAGLADVGTDALAGGLKKLNIAISAAASGSKEQAAIFKALGINIKDAQGNALSADKVFASLSDKFAESADGANKTAVAVALLGKNGADLVPLLNGGSQALKDLGDEATKLGIVLGPDFARNAEAFNDNLHKASLAGQGLAVTLGGDLVQYLSEATTEMANAAVEGGKLAGVWAGLKSLWNGPKQYQNDKALVEWTDQLANLESALSRFKSEGYALDGKVIQGVQAQIKSAKEQIAVTLEQRRALEGLTAAKAKAVSDAPKNDSAPIKNAAAALHGGKAAKDLEDSFVAGRTAAKDWAKSFEDFRKIAAEASAEVDGLGKAQARLLTYLGSDGYTNATEEMRQLALSEAYAAVNAEALAKATKQSAQEALEAVSAYADAVDAQQKAADTLREQVAAERDNVAAIGLSTEALADLVAAKYEDQAASKESLALLADTIDSTGAMGDAYREQAKNLRELASLKRAGALKEVTVEAAKKAQEEWKKTSESINRDITDALMRGFENGKGFAENLRDTIENMFKTMVLRPVVQAAVEPFAQGITGALGLGSGQSKGTGMADAVNTASNLNSLFGTVSQAVTGASVGASTASLVGANIVGAAGGDALGALIAGNGGWAGVSVAAEAGAAAGAASGAAAAGTATAAAGAGSGAAAAAGLGPVGWAALAAVALFSIFGEKNWETKYGGSFDNTAADSFGVHKISGPGTGGEFGNQYAQTALKATEIGINATLTKLGSSARVGYFSAGAESSDQAEGFANAGGKLTTGAAFGQSSQSGGWMNRRGDMTKEQAIAAYVEELNQATLQALQAATDLPQIMAQKLRGVNIDQLTGDSLKTFTAEVQQIITDAETLQVALAAMPFKNLAGLSYTASMGLMSAAGGLEAITKSAASYYDNFYSAEEKRATAVKSITTRLREAGANITTDQVGAASRAQFRAAAESLDVTTAAGQKLYAAMLEVSSAFASITTAAPEAATAVAQSLTQDLDARTTWQQKLDVLTGKTTERQLSLQADLASTTDATTQSLIRQVYAQEDLASAAEALKSALQTTLDASRTGVSDAVAAIRKSADAQKSSITTAYTAQAEAIRASLDTVGTSIGKLQNLSSSLKSTLDGMRIAGSDSQYRADAQAQIRAALATVRAGGALPLDGQLSSALSTVSKPSEQLFATFTDYARDFYTTANDLAALSDLTTTQLTGDALTQSLLTDQSKLLKAGFDAEVKRLDNLVTAAQAQADAALSATAAVQTLADAISHFSDSLGVTLTNTLSTAFSALDINQSGGVAWDEFQRAFGTLASESTLLKLFKQTDTNGNGQISQLEAINANTANLLAAMRISGAGGTAAGAGSYTGTQVAGAIKDMTAAGASAAQVVAAASNGYGVTSTSVAQVAAVTGNTAIVDYQKKADAVTALNTADLASVVAQAQAIAAAQGISPERALYNYATSHGINAASVDKYMGWPNGTSNAWATTHGYPAFAVGTNYVPHDMIAQIHEGEAIVPKAYNPMAQSQARDEAVVAELRALREEVRGLRAEAQATAGHTSKTARLLDRAMPDGDALATRVAA